MRARAWGEPLVSKRAMLGGALALLCPLPVWAETPSGPKKRLAVAKFDSIGKFSQALGSPDAGVVLADQLATILAQSGEFDVVDRGDPAMLLKEQSLLPKSAADAGASGQAADLVAAQAVIRGGVTSYEDETGGGLSLGVGSGALGGVLGRKTSKIGVGLDIRVVEVLTGRVIGAFHVKETAVNASTSVSLTHRGSNALSKDTYANSPLGEATGRAFAKAVPLVKAALAQTVWTGRIADVADGEAFLNLGAREGVKVGDRFKVSRVARTIVDPQSGEVLGVSETPLGLLEVTAVEDRFSRASPATSGSAPALKRGDVIRFAKGLGS